jgi:pyrimidine operon attenuation protein/uracil phosphoribosyltransferase
VSLLVLIDRRFSRELPIQPDYVGKWVDSIGDQRVTVQWKETDGQDRVLLHSEAASIDAKAVSKGSIADQ